MANIKISQLPNINGNLTLGALMPIVSVNGNMITDKITVANLANYILGQSGNLFISANIANLAYNVVNASQPNITTVGTLTGLTVVGTTNVGYPNNFVMLGGTAGQVLATFGDGSLGWVDQIGATGATGPVGDRYAASSTSNLTIQLGNISLVAEANLAYSVGQDITVTHDFGNYMAGPIITYDSNTGNLEFQSITIAGSGSYDSWEINLDGAVGAIGATGSTGPEGSTGPIGATGATGIQGIEGPTGATGLVGSTGDTGATGETGIDGATGATGPQGDIGATGASGTIGVDGSTGATGLTGATGVAGNDGATGATGLTGATGPAPTTASLNYSQTKSAIVDYTGETKPFTIVSAAITTNGGPVQVIATGDVNPLSSGGGWVRLNLYRDNTEVGQLIQCESAASNENIPYALQVVDTPSAGTYTYSLKFVSGSGGNFQFGEAAGPILTVTELQNVVGATGASGTNGATGATGPAGTNGTDGATGATGIQGLVGATGASGTIGVDGATGATGVAGTDGATGATGVAGLDGATGATGPAGADGATGATGIFGGALTQNLNGNGFNITNVATFSANTLQGTSANVSLVAGSYTWTFDNTGVFTLPAGAGAGLEGGELQLTQAANSTLAGDTVIIDNYGDTVRFFESGSPNKGAYIDLTQCGNSVSTLLNNRVSAYVNAGTYVTMDNLKATVSTSGNRSLEIATVSGSFSGYVNGTYTIYTGGTAGVGATITVTTTPALAINWNFTSAGDLVTYIITDTTNSRCYRVTMMIGPSYNNNMISIERLV